MLTLRDYQRAAVDAVTPDEHRALLVSGCGTGKTLMAVHAVAKLLAGAPGTVLLTFPTLGLLEQTYQVWRGEAPMPFSALAVCSQQISDPEDIADDELSIPSTTSAEQLAHWLADTAGVRVVFATYQSAAVLVEAHRAFSAAAWTVMVCDEAHRTAGRRGKPFAVVLDDHKIPAAHRLFFTATPKVHARGSSPSRSSARPRRNAVASMDNQDLYGRRVFSLPTRDAIQRGILSPFKVAVIAVTDSAVASALKDVRLISLAAGEDVRLLAVGVRAGGDRRRAVVHERGDDRAIHEDAEVDVAVSDAVQRQERVAAVDRALADGAAGAVRVGVDPQAGALVAAVRAATWPRVWLVRLWVFDARVAACARVWPWAADRLATSRRVAGLEAAAGRVVRP